MYDLSLTAEQLEFRDTVREFVARELKPAALDPRRLEPFEKPLLSDCLVQASRLGLRALALPDEAGGAGADCITCCIVLEELAAGDVDVATVLGHTALAAAELFGALAQQPALRERYLQPFLADDACHLALAVRDPDPELAWSYHRPAPAAPESDVPAAAAQPDGDWMLDGALAFVPNAAVAKLFLVEARAADGGPALLVVPRASAGLAVREPPPAVGEAGVHWCHGAGAPVSFERVRVAADHVLARGAASALGARAAARWAVMQAAINLGVGRAAHEAAVEYTKIRRQGGRHIVEHQAIGAILAEGALKLEVARTMVWKAAWAADHPGAAARADGELPLHTIARVFTAQAVHEVTLGAAECFGAMGVMRDMPLQKYVHDGLVFLHSDGADSALKLRIAEAVAGYRRALAA